MCVIWVWCILQEVKQTIDQYEMLIESMLSRSCNVPPLTMRSQRQTRPIPVFALCSYKHTNVCIKSAFYPFQNVFFLDLCCIWSFVLMLVPYVLPAGNCNSITWFVCRWVLWKVRSVRYWTTVVAPSGECAIALVLRVSYQQFASIFHLQTRRLKN